MVRNSRWYTLWLSIQLKTRGRGKLESAQICPQLSILYGPYSNYPYSDLGFTLYKLQIASYQSKNQNPILQADFNILDSIISYFSIL